MKELQITVTHEAGLHARPAALFVQTAAAFKANVQVQNNDGKPGFKNAKSIIEVLTLGVNQGHTITLRAEGEDEDDAIQALQTLIESNFTQTPTA